LGPILHVGEELAEKGERKKEGLEPGHKEGGGPKEEETDNSSNSKTVQDDSDYMEPIDAIPRGSSYSFKL